MLRTALTSVVLVVLPLSVGAAVGHVLRRVIGRRLAGAPWLIALLLLPPLLLTLLNGTLLVVGLWDAIVEGLFFGAGLVWTAHRAAEDRKRVALFTSVLFISLIALELGARVFMPSPPPFRFRDGPHLLLTDAVRSDQAGGEAAVCNVAYGAEYPVMSDMPPEWQTLHDYSPRPNETRHVLHLGDSMVAGQDVVAEKTFVSLLERMEPQTEEIRDGWGGRGPDTYLVVLEDWLAHHRLDAVVMYLFEGNDLGDLDSGYPCSADRSLLVYDDQGAHLRFPSPVLHAGSGWHWLAQNSPMPYVVRAFVGYSVVATTLVIAMRRTVSPHEDETDAVRYEHLKVILRTARDRLAAAHTPFAVVVLPDREVIEGRKPPGIGTRMLEISRGLGIPTLDATPPVKEAAARGEKLFLDSPQNTRPDCHFNEAGHALMAQWLHGHLPEALGAKLLQAGRQ